MYLVEKFGSENDFPPHIVIKILLKISLKSVDKRGEWWYYIQALERAAQKSQKNTKKC